jgi:tetratricopeptide (TPR) repeat protein
MYDIELLENEWKKYRRKKLKPLYITLAVVIFLLVPTLFFLISKKIDFSTFSSYFQSSDDAASYQMISTSSSENTMMKSTVLVNNALDRLETKETENLIDIADKPGKKSVNILVDVPMLDDTENTEYQEEISTERPKVHLDIVESTNVTAYKDVERRFMQSHEIDDALFLARSYYKKGDYKKSEYWALETNKLDENNEESLFIFVKSKVKLGHKNEAIAILNDYLKVSNSSEGNKLLDTIENNKL